MDEHVITVRPITATACRWEAQDDAPEGGED